MLFDLVIPTRELTISFVEIERSYLVQFSLATVPGTAMDM